MLTEIEKLTPVVGMLIDDGGEDHRIIYGRYYGFNDFYFEIVTEKATTHSVDYVKEITEEQYLEFLKLKG